MSVDPLLEMYADKAELIEKNEELERIRKENEELKNQMTANNLMKKFDDFQAMVSNNLKAVSTELEGIQENLNYLSARVFNVEQSIIAGDAQLVTLKNDPAALSGKVSNHDKNFSEINGTLYTWDNNLTQNNEFVTKQDEPIQVLKHDIENQTILLLGGYDEENNDSLLIIKLPYAIRDHGAQFLNNNLYIFGGEGKGSTFNFTYKLSKSLQWEKMADMNRKRSGMSNSSVILNNQIWVCGGENESQELKSVEMYDPGTNKWKSMKQMNECRQNAAAAVVNRKIFCCGGRDGGNILNSVECYNPFSDVWTLIYNMPRPIHRHCAVEMHGNFIIMGGLNYPNNSSNVWALNTMYKHATWIDKPSMSIPRSYFSVANIDGKVFICGGWCADKNVEIFDGKVWKNGPKMPTPRWLAPAVVIPMEFAGALEQFTAVPTGEQLSKCFVQ